MTSIASSPAEKHTPVTHKVRIVHLLDDPDTFGFGVISTPLGDQRVFLPISVCNALRKHLAIGDTIDAEVVPNRPGVRDRCPWFAVYLDLGTIVEADDA